MALVVFLIQAAGLGTAALPNGNAADHPQSPHLWPPSFPPGPAATTSQSPGMLVAICPSTPDKNEFVIVELLAAATAVEISDGEGTLVTEGRYRAGDRILFAANLSSIRRWSAAATYERSYESASVDGEFRLADDGDEVELLLDGRLGDSVIISKNGYGSDREGWHGSAIPFAGEGFSPTRRYFEGELLDTDSASDWDPLTRASPLPGTSWMESSKISVYQLPAAGLSPWARLLEGTSSDLDVSAYTLESRDISALLASAAGMGVRVRLLVESSPVGGRDWFEDCLLSALEESGVEVRLTGIADSLRYHHAKFAVADSARVLISTDNLVPTSHPPNSSCCTRGFAALLESPGLAVAAEKVFDHDWSVAVPPALPGSSSECAIDRPRDPSTYPPPLGTSDQGGATLITTPEAGSGPWARLVRNASSEVLLYASDFYPSGGPSSIGWTNPLLLSLEEAAARGTRVRMLTSQDSADSVIRWLRARPGAGAGLEVEPFGVSSLRLHAKLLVVDRQAVILGSVNPGFNSFHRNREMSLRIDSGELGSRIADVFALDRAGDAGPPVASITAPGRVVAGERVLLSGAGSVDDRGIAAYEWDLESDGTVDREGEKIEVTFGREGMAVVSLLVTDSAGQSDRTSVLIEVAPLVGPQQDVRATTSSSFAFVVAVLLLVLAFGRI
ncbi:MAG TPA: phospholipase D-like domain-containing protein, partial [Thermoplasmata archaeon]|nr:phospholipase D-like domain-containing protein [Thermoplasmata archaeon]